MSDRWHCYECGATLGYCKEFSGPVCFKCAPDLTAADTPTALADAVARVMRDCPITKQQCECKMPTCVLRDIAGLRAAPPAAQKGE